MTARMLGPGAMVLDAAGFVGLSDMSGFSAAGVDGVSLYVGGRYGVTQATVQAAWDANLVVQLNYERAEAAYLDGYNGGRAAADNALSQSFALGWDNDSPIVFSATDTGVANSQFVLADGWYRGMVGRMQANGATGGAYGPAAYLRHLAEQPWWPDDFVLWHWAGDGAKPESWTWAQQLYPGVTIAGVSVDKNRILKEYPFWSGVGHLNPEENVTDTEMDAIADKVLAKLMGSPDFAAYLNALDINVDRGAEFAGIIRGAVPTADQIAAAVVAKLPAGGTAAVDPAAIELGVKTVLEQTTYLAVPQFGTP